MATDRSDAIPLEVLTAIAKRLRPACPDIPEAEFQSLVYDVARVKIKYDVDKFGDLVTFTDAPDDGARPREKPREQSID